MSAITPLVQSGADLDCRSVPSGHRSARLRKQPILMGLADFDMSTLGSFMRSGALSPKLWACGV
jgi:hypothetical protein